MNTSIKIIIIIATLTLCGLIVSSILQKEPSQISKELNPVLNVSNDLETGTNNTDMTEILIPLASLDKPGEFGPFGCEQYINFHRVKVPKTDAVLQATYSQLFSLPHDAIPGIEDKNIIASQDNLSFESVTLENGKVSLYLSGSVMGNHCADEVFRHQIQQSAFQFETVQSLEVYLNNEIFDWCTLSDADPSESGCDINPRPWIVNKNPE